MIQLKNLKGLNLRNSDITRSPEYASSTLNVEKNSKGEIIKRWGSDLVLTNSGIIDLFEYVGVNRLELIALKSDGLYKLSGGTLVKIPMPTTGTYSWSEKTTITEYNNCLYLPDPSGKENLWKYDGYEFYRAGCPEPSVTLTGSVGTGKYWRIFISYQDPNGNITQSWFKQFDNIDTPTFQFQPITNTDYDGFKQRRGTVGVSQTIDGVTEPVPYTLDVVSHNFLAGEWINARTSRGTIVPLQIIAVTSVTIEFNHDQVDAAANLPIGLNYSFIFSNVEGVSRNYLIRIFSSTNKDFGYTYTNNSPNFGLNDLSTAFNISPTHDSANFFMTEEFDDSKVKILPPKFKYISTFQDSLIGGGLLENYTDASLNTTPADTIVWSDSPAIGTYGSVESFLAVNVKAVGITSEGQITALHGNDDQLVIHKQEQSFFLSGDLVTGNLRERKALTSEVGAASHRSIISVDGGHIYVANRGIYFAMSGNKPVELSDIIEPLFSDGALLSGELNLLGAKAVNDFSREKIYFWIPYTTTGGIILCYDYYYKEWYIHSGIDMSGGMAEVGKDIYYSDGTKIFKRNLTKYKDDTTIFPCHYRSGWLDLGMPFLSKSFSQLSIISILASSWTAKIKSYIDWDLTLATDVEADLGDTIKVQDHELNMDQCKALSFEIGNENDEAILITGVALDFSADQIVMKGED